MGIKVGQHALCNPFFVASLLFLSFFFLIHIGNEFCECFYIIVINIILLLLNAPC